MQLGDAYEDDVDVAPDPGVFGDGGSDDPGPGPDEPPRRKKPEDQNDLHVRGVDVTKLPLRAVNGAARRAAGVEDETEYTDDDAPDAPPRTASAAKRTVMRYFERGDHVEIGEALIDELGKAGVLVHDDGQLYRYSKHSHVFEGVLESEQSRIVQSFAGSLTGKKERPLVIRRVDVAGSMRLAWDAVATPDFFATARPGLAFRNGFVEVTAARILVHEHSSDHRARYAYPFAFIADANPMRFLAFLADAFGGDADASDKVKLLQEYVGASMLGIATKYQRAIVLLGAGANGKGVFTTITEAAMPPGSCCAIPPQEWADQYRLAMLAGKRLNVVSELPEADIIGTDAFKAVVAGDSLTGRHIRQAPFTFRPVAGHVFAANKLPGTIDQTHGFWRRFLVLPFERVFREDEQDPALAEKMIRAELPQIASWFLEGGRRVLEQGRYTVPTSSGAAVEKWKRHADQVRAFVDELAERLPPDAPADAWSRASDVYRRYRGWASENGHRPMASNSFGERMKLLGLASRHTKTGERYPVDIPASEDG
ncbi:MAG TPA: phage/plasmid primase, P4 family [Polyangiaceae bacterium]|nr:phage/plasmid primase, P4 family [Polyangiaceae bacterium]